MRMKNIKIKYFQHLKKLVFVDIAPTTTTIDAATNTTAAAAVVAFALV